MCKAFATEAGSVKEQMGNMDDWKENVDAASTQVASVLQHLQDQVGDIRYALQ